MVSHAQDHPWTMSDDKWAICMASDPLLFLMPSSAGVVPCMCCLICTLMPACENKKILLPDVCCLKLCGCIEHPCAWKLRVASAVSRRMLRVKLKAAPQLLKSRQPHQLTMAPTGMKMRSCLQCSKKPGSVSSSLCH